MLIVVKLLKQKWSGVNSDYSVQVLYEIPAFNSYYSVKTQIQENIVAMFSK